MSASSLIFETQKVIYFHQCDPAGVLFYGQAFQVAHDVYEDYLKSVELHSLIFQSTELAFPIRAAQAEFSAAVCQGEVDAKLSVDRVGESSFSLTCKLWKEETLLLSVTTTHVTMDLKNKKKAALPRGLVDKLSE